MTIKTLRFTRENKHCYLYSRHGHRQVLRHAGYSFVCSSTVCSALNRVEAVNNLVVLTA